jgi:hypothetical protein
MIVATIPVPCAENEMGDSQWYYALNGQQQGPAPFERLQQLAAAGQLRGGDLVWTDGMPNWQPAQSIPGLIPAAPQPPYVDPNAYNAPINYGHAQYPQGQSYNGHAIAGFVLSLVFPLLGLIFSLIALSGMKKSGNLEGRGLAQAGLIISIITMAIFVVLGVCFCIGIGTAGTAMRGF